MNIEWLIVVGAFEDRLVTWYHAGLRVVVVPLVLWDWGCICNNSEQYWHGSMLVLAAESGYQEKANIWRLIADGHEESSIGILTQFFIACEPRALPRTDITGQLPGL